MLLLIKWQKQHGNYFLFFHFLFFFFYFLFVLFFVLFFCFFSFLCFLFCLLFFIFPCVSNIKTNDSKQLLNSQFDLITNEEVIVIEFPAMLEAEPAGVATVRATATIAANDDGGAGSSGAIAGESNAADDSIERALPLAYGVANVAMLVPSAVPVDGGVDVDVRGANFANSPDLACKVGPLGAVKATFVMDTLVVCKVPAHVQGEYALEVSNDGKTFTNSGGMYFELFLVNYIYLFFQKKNL